MNIRVKPDTEAWLTSQVSEGRYSSVEEAVEVLVLEHQLFELDIAADDHLWAKPAIDEALASLQRGEGSPLADVARRLKERIAARS